jgi:hypothetical protein
MIMSNITAEVQDDGSVNLTGVQGSTWTLAITLTDSGSNAIDLTGYTARAQIRKTYATTTITKSFTCTIDAPLTGVINLSMSASDTSAITCGKTSTESASTYVYDIEVYTTADAEVDRIMGGKLYVSPEVTKSVIP